MTKSELRLLDQLEEAFAKREFFPERYHDRFRDLMSQAILADKHHCK
jgi:hypothetical protein